MTMYDRICDFVKKRWLYLLTLTLFIPLFISVVADRSKEQLDAGKSFIAQKNRIAAIAIFERSALNYAPLLSTPEEGIKELKKIRDSEIEAEEDAKYAELAEHALIRIKRQIYPASLKSLGDEIPTATLDGGGVPLPRRVAIHISFLLCIGGILWIIWRGFTPDGEIKKRGAYTGVFIFATSLIVWLSLLAV